MAGLLNFHNVPLQRETYEAPVMVLEDLTAGPDPEETCIDAVGILDRWNPSGIMKGDFCEITAAILEAAGQVDKAEEAPKRPKAPDPVSPGKLEEAADLVARVMQIKEAEGLTIREACRMAGTSWSTFQRRKKSLKAQEKDREEEEEAKT